MNITDLMVGDWVYNGECRSNMSGDYDVFFVPKQLTLEDFKFFADNDWNNYDFDEFLKPIELTPEILESNGFFRLGNQYNTWCMRGFNFSLDFIDGIFGYYEQGRPHNPTFVTKYVHELQHALKLCGIEKEIVI